MEFFFFLSVKFMPISDFFCVCEKIFPVTNAFAVSQRRVGEIFWEDIGFACKEVVYWGVVSWWEKKCIYLWKYFLIQSWSCNASFHSVNLALCWSRFGLRNVFQSSLMMLRRILVVLIKKKRKKQILIIRTWAIYNLKCCWWIRHFFLIM